jgi:hypothetical protein
VKTHIGRLLSKLDARDRAQLVVIAYQSGFATGPRWPLAAHHSDQGRTAKIGSRSDDGRATRS